MSKPKQHTGEMVPAPPAPPPPQPSVIDSLGMLAHYRSLPSAEGAGIMTTLDLRDRGNVLIVQRALAGASISLWDTPPDTVIEITDIIAHYAEREDEETGEMVSGPMLTLIGPGGTYHTGSMYAFRALQGIALLVGTPPWHPPIRIRAERVRSRNKRDFQSIILCE